jgi:uncharacterized RDD family membrane protein YckC
VSVVTFAVRLPIVLLLDSHDFEADLYIMLAYALYRSVFVARSGRTLGLWLFELEVVGTETGGKPALRQAVIRVLVPAGVVAIATVPDRVLGLYDYKLDTIAQIVVIAIACLPPLALLWASLRSVGKQTIWDKLSHTMVRYRTRRTTAI